MLDNLSKEPIALFDHRRPKPKRQLPTTGHGGLSLAASSEKMRNCCGMMWNTLPVTQVPKPTPTRAVMLLEPQPMKKYLAQPHVHPTRRLLFVSSKEMPAALDGVVPDAVYSEAVTAVETRARTYRGGAAAIILLLSQALLLTLVTVGFVVTNCTRAEFFNPVTLAILASAELLFLAGYACFNRAEESRLVLELLSLLRPWKERFGVSVKVRKARGKIDGRKDPSTFYCLVLQKRSNNGAETASLSSAVTSVDTLDV